jgi:hypothetical protein
MLETIPNNCKEIMPLEKFLTGVQQGVFTNEDGDGFFGREDTRQMDREYPVFTHFPYDMDSAEEVIQKFTHVAWFPRNEFGRAAATPPEIASARVRSANRRR